MKIQLVVKGLIVCTLLILLIGCVPPQATIIPPTSLNPTIAPTMTTMPSTVPTEVVSETLTLTPTIEPSSTVVSTDTPTLLPTPTVFLPPADGILFQDDFDDGFKPDWHLGSDWITADGTLSQIPKDTSSSYSWATLNKPEWKNYIVSVKINIPYMYSAAQSDVAVAVRVNGQARYLGVQILPFVGNALFFIGSSNSDSDAVAQSRVFDFDSGSTLEIEANGNNYIVRVNGRQVQQVSLSGYDSGGIALGIDCGSSLGCPSFDNVKVTYLP